MQKRRRAGDTRHRVRLYNAEAEMALLATNRDWERVSNSLLLEHYAEKLIVDAERIDLERPAETTARGPERRIVARGESYSGGISLAPLLARACRFESRES